MERASEQWLVAGPFREQADRSHLGAPPKAAQMMIGTVPPSALHAEPVT